MYIHFIKPIEMNVHNQFGITLLLVLILFSCKKERLKDEYSILIGEWTQTKLIDQFLFDCNIDTIESSHAWKITFNENGKVFLTQYETKDKYLIQFKNKKSDISREEKKVFYCFGEVDSIENFYTFEPQITQRFDKEEALPIIYVTEEKLVIESNSALIISPPCEECMDLRYVHHFFNKK